MLNHVLKAARDIQELRIQGARNVAISAIKALDRQSKATKARTTSELWKELEEAHSILSASRETEPLMRNALRRIIYQAHASDFRIVRQLVDCVAATAREFLEELDSSKRQIVEIGAKRIRDGSAILTHCHSSTVTETLGKAKRDGKKFRVIVMETRPLFQGRTTAKEMLDLGIETTMIVDSAMRYFINEADLILVGADAITSEGNIVNKIGTSLLALASHEARTPFYVACELLKFDPDTLYGEYEGIEERSHNEVWENPPKKLQIRNPAFDVTRRDFIHGIICEQGIISPHSITETVRRCYPWVLE